MSTWPRAVARYLRSVVPALLLWHLVALATANPVILPTPVAVAQALVEGLGDGTLVSASATSLGRLATGYLLAVAVCVPLGVAMGLSGTVGALVDPVVEILRPISGIAWIPLALILFGIGDGLVLFIIAYGAAFPVILNTVAGVREVDRSLLDAARTFGTPRTATVTQVVIPAALPMIFVGLRIGLGTAWISLVAAELVGAGSGLGYLLSFARQLLMSADMMAGIVVIGVLGVLSNGLLSVLQRWAAPWSTKEVTR